MRCEICGCETSAFRVIPIRDDVNCVCEPCEKTIVLLARRGKMVSELPVGGTLVVTREGYGLAINGAGFYSGKTIEDLMQNLLSGREGIVPGKKICGGGL